MRIAVAACGVAAVLAVALAWLQNPAHVTASEAAGAAQRAFLVGGISGAKVDPDPAQGVYTSKSGVRSDVWKTRTAVEGGTVELWLARSDGELMFLDDRTPDGASQLLTDKQFKRLSAFRENPAVSRQVRRNITLTVAAVLVLALAAYLLWVRDDEPPRPAPEPPPLARPRRTQPLRAT